jgi:YidC/Oxa1 family membrane protein insertase
MLSAAYNFIIFKPLYNLFVGLLVVFPWLDAGGAIIIFTIIVRLILFPLSRKALITQLKMKDVQPKLKEIQVQHKDNREAQAIATMQLYKQEGVNPFSSFILLFVQLPILIALYSVFRQGFPEINPELLYHFVTLPHFGHTLFGFIDITSRSLVLALCVAVSQFFQISLSLRNNTTVPSKDINGNQAPKAFSEEVMMSAMKQMRFVMPVFAFIATYYIIPHSFPKIGAAIAIYWTVSNLFTIGQEIVIRRGVAKKAAL